MISWILNYNLDCLALTILSLGSMAGIHVYTRRRGGAGVGAWAWAILLVLLLGGSGLADLAARHERTRLKHMLEGIAPTYAYEFERLGHDKINLHTSPTDPLYLKLIQTQIDWEKLNPGVADIYTFGRRDDGKIVMLVDSETDYDQDGVYSGEREQRTPIGEVYDQVDPGLLRAFAGETVFDDVISTDRWGSWVSDFVPLHDASGHVNAVLGVDYSADSFLHDMAIARIYMLGLVGVVVSIFQGTTGLMTIMRGELIHRRAVERALRASELHLRTILDHAPDWISTRALDGNVIDMNAAGLALLEADTLEEVRRRRVEDMVHPDDRSFFGGITQRARAGQTAGGEFRVVGLRASLRWIEARYVPLPGGDGRMTAILCCARDITAQKQAQAEHQRLQRELLEASRRAGMAEVATGVLHNVGNVLNSVTVSVGLVCDLVKQSRLPNLAKAAQLLSDHEADLPKFLCDDERGRQLPAYVTKLSRFLVDEHAGLLTELAGLSESVEHVTHIVRLQQSHAKGGAMLESVRPEELMDEAMQVNLAAFGRHGIDVTRDFSDLPPLPLDRHRVLQILVNLITNAKVAVSHVPAPRRITLRVALVGPDRFCFTVNDNGVGIAPEQMTRIFTYGFTTRGDGHGFGLHSAANAAREMGGALTASSPGPGQGATFKLELPLAPAIVVTPGASDAGATSATSAGANDLFPALESAAMASVVSLTDRPSVGTGVREPHS